MPLNKNGATAAAPVEAPKAAAPAAEAPKVETSSKKLLGEAEKNVVTNNEGAVTKRRGSSERDYEAETKGKVACVAFGDALGSPGVAQLPFKSIEEYLALVTRAADAMVEYTWKHQNQK